MRLVLDWSFRVNRVVGNDVDDGGGVWFCCFWIVLGR